MFRGIINYSNLKYINPRKKITIQTGWGVEVKSKIAFMVCTVLCFLSVPVFALDVTTDVLLGGFYNYSNVFTGKSKYQTINGYDNITVDGDYNAIFRAGGEL